MSNKSRCLAVVIALVMCDFCGCHKTQTASTQGAATPEELIARMVDAIKSGDPEALAVITASPGDEVIRAKARRVRDIRAASQALTKQCDDTFGPREQATPAFGSVLAQRVMDDAFPAERQKRKSEATAKLIKQEALPDGQLKLTLGVTETWDGQTRTDTDSLTAVKTETGWKLTIPQGLLELQDDSPLLTQQLLNLFQSVTKEVRDGQFRKRDEVDYLIARELINYLPSVLVEAEIDPSLRADAARLDLAPPPFSNGYPVADIRVEVGPDADTANVLLRFDVMSRESSIELLPEHIEDLQKHLSLPDGFPIKVVVHQGVKPEAILPVLHAMLDLRVTSPRPAISLSVEYSEDWNAISPQLTGRLRLYTIAAPKVDDPLRLQTDGLLEESPSLSDAVEMLKDDLKRDNPLEDFPAVPPPVDVAPSISSPDNSPLLEIPTTDHPGTTLGSPGLVPEHVSPSATPTLNSPPTTSPPGHHQQHRHETHLDPGGRIPDGVTRIGEGAF